MFPLQRVPALRFQIIQPSEFCVGPRTALPTVEACRTGRLFNGVRPVTREHFDVIPRKPQRRDGCSSVGSQVIFEAKSNGLRAWLGVPQ